MDEGYIGSCSVDESVGLDLRSLPPIYVSSTHFDTETLHHVEDDLTAAGAILTYDVNEARVVLSKAVRKKRIQYDLRAKGLWTKELRPDETRNGIETNTSRLPGTKKRKRDLINEVGSPQVNGVLVEDSTTASEDEAGLHQRPIEPGHKPNHPIQNSSVHAVATSPSPTRANRIVTVVKMEWFTDSQERNQAQPLDAYITYQGRCIERAAATESPIKSQSTAFVGTGSPTTNSQHDTASKPTRSTAADDIIQRAQDDASQNAAKAFDCFGRRKFGLSMPSANPSTWEAGHGTSSQHAHLLQQTTTEHEGGTSSDVPEMPEWVKSSVKYACQRRTMRHNPNESFMDLLQKVKLARHLTNDEIGVRAYSTSIASLAAYPYKISNPREILSLPGCDKKIANYFVEWSNTGRIKAVDDLEADEDLKVLKMFYNIWGVGSTTAQDFYFKRGWRDLDDIIEYGWKDLSRVQQIGVKYYDEFLDLIPRAEVEMIGEVIHQHAVKVRDQGIRTMLVGGYRRGKEASGDVDIVVSHLDENATLSLVDDIVTSLEEAEWITHTLTLSLHNTERGQQTLPFRAGGGGHGFDTLDKALVVWQNPDWPTKARDLAGNPEAKNPNIHRRVDIIVSPWRTVGCAVVGWSGGTTFERDLRRYAKDVKTWKFDSSGVRDRRNGEVVDVEGYFEWKGQDAPGCRAKTMEEAERRVFEGLDLTYRGPWERCTG